MKTTKTKLAAKIFAAAVAFAALAMMTACSKKDGGSAADPNPYVIPGCVNCTGTGSLLGGPYYSTNSAQTIWMTVDIMAFQQVTGTCPTNYPYNPYNPPAPGCGYTGGYSVTTYQGTAAMRGTIRISAQDYSTCYAPPGDYVINTVQAGQMYAATITGLRVDAVGPNNVHIILDIYSSQLYKSQPMSSMQPDRIGISAQFSINGYNCGTMSTY